VSAPLLGRTVRAVRVARLVRVLGVLLESRVPLLEALSIAQSCTNSGLYGRLIEATSQRVERGEPLADTLAASPLVDPSVAEAIRSGEQTGRVGPVLVVMADMMDEDNALLIRTLTSVMEPVILALLGVLVGGVAISLFLPLFDLTAATGGG
jgi:type II secretory pathway component PulF